MKLKQIQFKKEQKNSSQPELTHQINNIGHKTAITL
jgi:hypothetical protein